MTTLASLTLLLALLPLALTVLNLRALRPPVAVAAPGPVSVLVPARNEEANIQAATAAILASTGIELELIVLDDASTDATPAILAAIPDPRLRTAQAPPLPPGWSGKQHACHVLSTLARHDLMVFVDADVRLAPDALARMAGFMATHPCGLASGFPRQLTLTWSEQLLLPLIHLLLLGYLPMRVMATRTSPGLGAGCGQLFIARRPAYLAAGGHAAIRASLHDGLTLPRALRRAGHLTLLFDATPIATCRMYATARQVWDGLSKNATEGMATWRALPLWTLLLGGANTLPLILLLIAPTWPAALVPALALAASLATRLILAARFRQPLLSALLNPIGAAALLALQWTTLLRTTAGHHPTWRGRSYPAQ